ncbi:TPA: acyltransferase family protein [Vibrio parahaemolyticus]
MINSNIQILRGISVLLVLLFHLDINAFKFGYVGVDIFFLISGFLMPIILPKYDAWGFIRARISRLLPALSAVVLTTLVLGYFFQLPGEYSNLAISSLSSFVFLSQFYFIFNTGYFNQESIFQPLLHTWSLGNEFLAYVLVFIAILLLPRNKVKNVALAIVMLSAAYIICLLTFSSINYLDPVPRMFLFFSAFYVSYKKDEVKISDRNLLLLSAVSFLLICIFFSEEILLKSWPNYSILLFPGFILPLMLMKAKVTPFSMLNRLLHKVGDWSYSIYIWHWPVIAFERIYLRNAYISNKEAIFLFSISIALGIFSYLFIERRKKLGNVGLVVSILLISGVLITSGAAYRTPESLNNYASVEQMIDNQYFTSKSEFDDIDVFKVSDGGVEDRTIVIGDSHSRHILPIYKSGYSGIIYRVSLQPEEANKRWDDINNILETLDIDKIIFSYRLHTKKINDIDLLVGRVNQSNFNEKYRVTFIRDIPSFDGDPISCLFANESDLMFKGCGFDIKSGLPIGKVFNEVNPVWELILDKASNNIQLIDTHEKLCNDTSCVTTIENEFILRDSNHFNEKMSKSANQHLYELLFSSEFDINEITL